MNFIKYDDGLPRKLVNILHKAGLTTKDQVRSELLRNNLIKYRGISSTYISQIKDWLGLEPVELALHDLSTRALNVLIANEVYTLDAAKHAIITGAINLRKTRNMGVKTFNEICDWLKIVPPPEQKSEPSRATSFVRQAETVLKE